MKMNMSWLDMRQLAMGAIGDMSVVPILKAHLADENPEVSESCEVARIYLTGVIEKSSKSKNGD